MKEKDGKKIVLRMKAGDDRREIYASTYQMKNPFHSFADGCITENDVFCYFQHVFSADLCPREGARVLDMCCGRGLLLPFLRYRGIPRGVPRPSLYVGVDLEPKNAQWKDGFDPRRRGKEKKESGWGFEILFVESSVAEMVEPLRKALPGPGPVFDFITFTSSIEHMQPDAQRAALQQAREVAHGETIFYLTCPITPEDRDGYDCQYSAHIYEPKSSELKEWLDAAGWKIEREIGLVTKIGAVKDILILEDLRKAKKILRDMPREMALPVIAHLFPQCATEMAYICSLKQNKRNAADFNRKAQKVVPGPKPGEGLLAMLGKAGSGG